MEMLGISQQLLEERIESEVAAAKLHRTAGDRRARANG